MDIKYRLQLPALLKEKRLPLIAAELGCAEGYNSLDLLNGGIEKLYMVDNWGTIAGQKGDGGYDQAWHDSNYERAMKHVSDYLAQIIVLRGLTSEMHANVPDNSLGLLYLDANHSYEGVMQDLELWYPKVIKGCVIAGHDYLSGHYGINQAVKEFTKKHGIFEVLTIQENKPEDAGFLFYKP